MTRVQISTSVRIKGAFLPIGDVDSYDGDVEYVPGAISLCVDQVEVMGIDLWDDVDWLWPFVIRALDDCRRTGTGKIGFPDQPISFSAERQGGGTVRVIVSDGDTLRRVAVAPERELLVEAARAGREFFQELRRICPGAVNGDADGARAAVLRTWLEA